MKIFKHLYFWVALVILAIVIIWLLPTRSGMQVEPGANPMEQQAAAERTEKVAEVVASGNLEELQKMTPDEKAEYRRQRRMERIEKNIGFVNAAHDDVIAQIQKLVSEGEYQKLLNQEDSQLKRQLKGFLPQLENDEDFQADNVIRLLQMKKQETVSQLQQQLNSQ